jgi:uncharacterized protein (DUF433 family)
MHSRVIKMSVTELLQAVRFLVDKDGNKTAAVLEYTLWEKLLTLLEDLEDAEEVQRLREAEEEYIAREQTAITDGAITAPGFDRITFDPNVMGGRACIRGMRVTVSLVLNLVANGMSTDQIIEAYPYLEPDDIRQVLQYAAWLAEETVHAWEPAA